MYISHDDTLWDPDETWDDPVFFVFGGVFLGGLGLGSWLHCVCWLAGCLAVWLVVWDFFMYLVKLSLHN